MSSAYDMHANWREVNPREVLRKCRLHGGTITPYARDRAFRSYIVSWSNEGCEGHLYVIRCQLRRRSIGPWMRSRGVDSMAWPTAITVHPIEVRGFA